MDGARKSGDASGPPEPCVIGVGLGPDESALLDAACREHAVTLHRVDDVRTLTELLIDVDCGGIVMGDQTTGAASGVHEINIAALTRFRAHPACRMTPVLYLVHWPVRDHVLQLTRLGVHDVVGQPARKAYVEERIARLIEASARAPERRSA